MHTDARQLEDQTLLEGDICIIGAGAAGLCMALDWMDTPYKVILLEGGGFAYDDQVQDLYKGESTGQQYYPLRASRLHYFGGTTGHWAGMCSPFDPIDFQKREWVPDSGWPITREDLDPYYARAGEKLKIGPHNFELEYWREQLPNLTPFPLDDRLIHPKMWQYSLADFNELYSDTIRESRNIHLYTYANVVDIRTNEAVSEVSEVIVKNHAGKTHRVRARHFILAAGAIQNARLLLASNSQAPRGLGNDHDQVGRYFMEHLEIACAELWLFEPLQTDLYTWKYGETKASAELAITEEAQRTHRILNGTASLKSLAFARHAKPRMETFQDEDPRKAGRSVMSNWAEARKEAKKAEGPLARAFQLDIRIEQLPNPSSRVTIDTEKDALGVPRPRLHWELDLLTKKSIRRIFELIGHEMGRTGTGRLRMAEFLRDETDPTWPDGTNGGWHHMGTTRMSDDPQKGVVDANCQVHGIHNLYVAGSGCFSTAGAANPTYTLTALSLRLSDLVKGRMGAQ